MFVQIKANNPQTKIFSAISNRKSFYSFILIVLFLKRVKKRVKKSRYRMNTLKQWIKTEQSYQNDLQLGLKYIKQPLIKENIITYQQGATLCPSFQPMIILSKMMLEVFEKSLNVNGNPLTKSALNNYQTVIPLNPNQIMIGKQLCSFAQGYKTYSQFFGNQCYSQKLLNELLMNHTDRMKDLEKDLQIKACLYDQKKQCMTIKDCLTKPLYRIFKYDELISQYLKRLPKDHPDYKNISQAQLMFREINFVNNEKKKKSEMEQKKIKLQKFLGRPLEGAMNYIAEMQAETIYFKVKIYIFNTFVLLSKNEEGIVQKETKYLTIDLDQFSSVSCQHDTKYFKTVLVLIGANISIHLFFTEEGSRAQLQNLLIKVIRDIKDNDTLKRKRGQTKKHQRKIRFTLEETQKPISWFQSGFRIEVLGIQIRPLTSITNQTVYITRFMLPQFYSDWLNLITKQRKKSTQEILQNRVSNTSTNIYNPHTSYNSRASIEKQQPQRQQYLNYYKNNIWINQICDLHLSNLQKVQEYIIEKFPSARLPEMNPTTKQINLYTDGRKTTKSFQVRSFYIEQYLNSLFRHPTIMANPLQIIKALRLEVTFWEYTVDKIEKTLKSSIEGPSFGEEHCQVCKNSNINSIQQFQKLRNYYRRTYQPEKIIIDRQRYCFNFYNIIRIKLLKQNSIEFNNLQRILLGVYYHQGKLDYPFLYRYHKKPKILRINLLGLDKEEVKITIFEKTTVGQIIEHLACKYNVPLLFDYCLTAIYFDKERTLGEDQYIMDITKQLLIKLQNVQSSQENQQDYGLWASFKQWGKQLLWSSENNKITLKKKIFLNKNLQMKSLQKYPEKMLLVLNQAFKQVSNGSVRLTIQQLALFSGLYYCLKSKTNYTKNQIIIDHLRQIIPQKRWQLIKSNKLFMQIIRQTIQTNKKYICNSKLDLIPLYTSILNIVYAKSTFTSYFVPVILHTAQTLSSQYIGLNLILGVNYRQIILLRQSDPEDIILSLPISQVKCTTTVYSIFLTHENIVYRFDGRMFQGFSWMFSKYQLIHKEYPQHSG